MVLIIILVHSNSNNVFDHPILLGGLNTFFLSIIPFFVAYTMARAFMNTGDVPLLILCCGMVALGLGGLSSGWFVAENPNVTATVYNTSASICAVFHIIAFLIFRFDFKINPVKARLYGIAGSVLILCFINLGVIYASYNGVTPVYIVQGEGPTLFGRVVLGVAISLFAVSAVMAAQNYAKTGLKFVSYYSTGLSLIAIGLLGVFLQKSVGSPIGWAGRASQYIGCLFIFIGDFEFWRMKLNFDLSFQSALENVFIESRSHYRALIEGAPIGIIATDKRKRIVLWNKAAEEIFGYNEEQVKGISLKTLIFTENSIDIFRHQLEKSADNGKPRAVEVEVVDSSGRLFTVEISVARKERQSDTSIIIVKDIRELKRAQEEILQLERLKTVGQMAAGIGHEIRNPMTSVRGFLQLLGTKPQYSSQSELFNLMISELDRANSIITEFLSFAKVKPHETRLMNLNDIIKRIYPLIQAEGFSQGKQTDLKTALLPDIEIDEKEITQLILNIAKNGLEAMDKGGCITIETYTEDNYVILKIMDEGCGIAQENLKNIGIPFFTTKESGTGLGLAISYKIAQSHNAKIDVESNSYGTAFFVRFPKPELL